MSFSSGSDVNKGSLQLITSDEGSILLDIEHDRILKLNPVCAEMWRLLSAGESEPQIVLKIAEEYKADVGRVTDDVRTLLERIRELQLSPANSILPPKVQPTRAENREPSFPWYGQTAGGDHSHEPEFAIVVGAFIGLMAFDLILSLLSFESLCSRVKAWPTRRQPSATSDITARICASVQRACVWYPKRALCLQRSAVTTCLLRVYGIAAEMVVGVRPMPFMAHAWVEVNGAVVNDWPGVRNFYSSLISR